MTTQKQPKLEWGFYASVPRIVRTQYKDLSHAEKWLYTCLKDLCGNKGTCFRSLRSLEEETGVSLASLSKMIPNLHKSGLIHAEKKRRSESGKEVWHISIVDIWQANHDYCSKSEQPKNEGKEVVQNPNNVVQNPNDKADGCSENERGCSNFSDRRITLKNNPEEESNLVAAIAVDESPFSFPVLDTGIEAVADETFKIAVLDDWREYKHLPRLAPTIGVMSETLKRLQRANGYRIAQDEIPSPSHDAGIMDDPHTGQLVDRVTTSDIPKSLDVVGVSTPSPSQENNDMGKNLPRQDSHPTASTSTSKRNKQPPIAKETTREPTMQERIVLVFQSFNEFASEALGQPFEYEQSAKNFGIIGKWLKAKATNPPTKEILHDVFFDMLAEAEGDRSNGSFSWIKNMDIPVVIKQYDRRSLGIMFKRKRHTNPKEVKSTAEIAETIGYKIVEADEELAYIPPTRKKA